MIGDPLQPLDGFIEARLNGDTTLVSLLGGAGRIWRGNAPQSFVGPIVRFDYLSAVNTQAIGVPSQGRVMTQPLYIIEAIVPGNSYTPAAAIFDRVDRVIVAASGSVPASNLFISSFSQEQPGRAIEVTPEGTQYAHQGGRYRVVLTAIS